MSPVSSVGSWSGSAMVDPRHTQSRQSIFFRSASWLGCLTREAGPADEFAGLLRKHPLDPVGRAVLGFGRVLVVLGLLDDQPLLQDGVQAGLDVLVVGLLLVLFIGVLAGGGLP